MNPNSISAGWRPYYWQPAAAFCLLVIACLWFVAPSPTPMEWRIGRILGEHTLCVYNGLLALLAALVLGKACRAKDSSLAWRVADLVICSLIATWVFKLACPFPRPSGGPHGFPSGHTLGSFMACWLFMETFPNASIYAFAVAVAVGWSRVEIKEHFVYQVICGALLGMLVGYFVSRARPGVGVVLPRLFRRRPRSSESVSPEA